ncbi:MAG TPA: UvrD-helicase domain-containing protein [Firmicutes bacterium]|nr:UvrD-helicase domain-containing protein [Bacillota bacterium]
MQIELQKKFLELRRKILDKRFSYLNPAQRKAVYQMDGPVLILAGAGSGKTTVVVNRIANMLRYGDAYNSDKIYGQVTQDQLDFLQAYLDGVHEDEPAVADMISVNRIKPWNILSITFTNKAAGELKERLEKMLGEDAAYIQASTFHSCCVRILRREIDKLGYASSFTIYDTDDSVRVIKECMKNLRLDEKSFPPKAMLNAIGRAKDQMIYPADYLANYGADYRQKTIAQIYEAYQSALKKADALDFDDIISLTVTLFEKFPEVLEYYQDKYRYIMVDEYQDTNYAQYRLISLLASKYRNLCVVGDDDQSIYKFRGATIENILHFEDQFQDTLVIRLEQNYRSTEKILDAANHVIENNTHRKGKNLWTDKKGGEKITVYRAQDDFGEAQFITTTIMDNVLKGRKYSDHAILYRMNAQSNNLENHLLKGGIPYRMVGGLRFYERKEIKDLIAYLSVINNPSDTLRLRRIVNEPKRGIGEATMATAVQISQAVDVSLFEVLEHAGDFPTLARKSGALMQFAQMIRSLMQKEQELSLEEFFRAVLEDTGYLRYLELMGDEGVTRIENVNELTTNIIKYEESTEEPSLGGFLEEVALFTDLDNYDTSADAVTLMTMHAAKGLEFPFVFIPGMEEGIFPGMQSMYNPEEVEEERRLAYVGITRAKEKLYLTSSATRMLFGSTVRNRPSRFIGEIPQDLTDVTDETVRVFQNTDVGTVDKKAQRKMDISISRSIGIAQGKKQASASVSSGITFSKGDTVSHSVFGTGIVLSAKPMGNDTLLEIAFDKVGTKKIMANFAKIKLVN